jgi:hypothetical protein
VKNASVDKGGSQQSPIPAFHHVVEAEEKVLLDKFWVLLPGPKACRYANDDKKRIYFQMNIRASIRPQTSDRQIITRFPSPLGIDADEPFWLASFHWREFIPCFEEEDS